MKQILLLASLILLAWTSLSLAAVPESAEAQKILNTKCNKCHLLDRIDQALAEHRDMLEIQQRMIRHGAELDSHEQQVLGIYYRNYATDKASTQPLPADPLAEYRSVVAARCSGCHSLAIVEKAMREKRDFGSLAQMMIKRGAVLNTKDMKIIQTFWGQPLR
ncbi:hypothetical protein [Geopsychrobacter electrodiphilus]|uniref:hypothetical protein n=1 Tax=Geopsychrobacter electrodiphilus TaxID=225196 RepID=UPI000362F345|nr:hypothetical protein [Geopsychrobacter electrodiphilus]